MTTAQIITMFRDLTNDKGAANNFWSDANFMAILFQNWQIHVASKIKWPRAEQSGSISVGGNSLALNADISQIYRVYFYDSTSGDILIPIEEEELSLLDPNYRQASNSTPGHYYIKNQVTGAAATPTRTMLIYPPTDTAKTLLISYVQVPAAVTNSANSTVHPECLHMHAAYWCAANAMFGRNPDKAATLMALAEKEWTKHNREARNLVGDPLAMAFPPLSARGVISSKPTLSLED